MLSTIFGMRRRMIPVASHLAAVCLLSLGVWGPTPTGLAGYKPKPVRIGTIGSSTLYHTDVITALAFSPSGEVLAAAANDGIGVDCEDTRSPP